jgi:hypothetical protein
MAHAQNLRISSQIEGVTASVVNEGTVTFPAGSPGLQTVGVIFLANAGSSPINVVQIGITAPSAFSLAGVPSLPASIGAGNSITFLVQHTSAVSTATATVAIATSEGGASFTYGFRLASAVSGFGRFQFEASYEDPLTNNSIRLFSGGVIAFPNVDVGDRSTIGVVLANRGAAPGVVNRITVNGSSAFQVVQTPVLPYTVNAGAALQFAVRFAPEVRQTHSAMLRIEAPGVAWDIRLEGVGAGPAYAYSIVTGSSSAPVTNGVIPFAGTPVGRTQRNVLRIQNVGTSQGRISGFALAGNVFQIVDAPFTPVLLNPGASAQVTFAFTPPNPGPHSARVQIGEDALTLSGSGLGALLEYSYGSTGSYSAIAPGDAIVLSSAAVGEISSAEFTISNTGNQAIPFFAIGIVGGATSAFYVLEVPALPLNLEAGASLTVTLRFAPDNVGTLNASLGVNGSTFSVLGTGLPPSRLPQHRFEGVSENQEALQQPAIGLSLSEPYPLDLKGVLTLAFVSDVFGGNPAVQFSSGGRTAPFVIPANSTQAVFDNSQTTVRIQTGTVAGNLVVMQTLSTRAGLILISDDRLTMSVPRIAPRLLEAQISNRTTDRFVVTVTGYSTTRSLRQLDLQLNAKSGVRLDNALLTVDLQSPALLWFQSPASEAFGGLFKIAVPVQLQGGSSSSDRVARLESVAVRVSNELGAADAITLPLQ